MTRRTLAAWFDAHKKAAQQAAAYVQNGGSGRACVAWLQSKHAYPFRDHTKLQDYLRREFPAEYSGRAKVKPKERFLRTEREIKALDKAQDIFFTCAVSSSPVCKPALRALEHAAAECGGKIVVVPIRYVNPTRPGETREDEWWDEALRPYLIEQEIRPHPLLSLMTTRVQATANNPLPARIDGRTKARSAVFGHPQLAMRTVATPQNKLPKIMYSSGAITEKAYSSTLAGDLADFHHSVGAVKIEVRGKRFHLREIVWDGKQFVDIRRAYTPRGVKDAARAKALILGDVHVGLSDEEIDAALFGLGGMLDVLQPEVLGLHDIFDGRAVNPHERGNALLAAVRNGDSVADEIAQVAEWLQAVMRDRDYIREAIVVRSNHDIFLDRWLAGGRPEPRDAELFHYLSWQMLRAHRDAGQFPNPLELALSEHTLDKRIRFLALDESYQLADCELGMHGHLGPDGARGTPDNLRRIGTRFVAGHRHSPAIWQGGYWTGISCRYRHGYNAGPSSWMASQVAILCNGLRQMQHVIGGAFRG